MSNKAHIFVDLDGTCCFVGNRFLSNPPPANLGRGDDAYENWLDSVQTESLMMNDKPVYGMQMFLESLGNFTYFTSRSEKLASVTNKWLTLHNFPIQPMMFRKLGDNRTAAEVKLDMIREHVNDGDPVIVIDDDPKGDIENMCVSLGYTLLKARSGGEVS